MDNYLLDRIEWMIVEEFGHYDSTQVANLSRLCSNQENLNDLLNAGLIVLGNRVSFNYIQTYFEYTITPRAFENLDFESLKNKLINSRTCLDDYDIKLNSLLLKHRIKYRLLKLHGIGEYYDETLFPILMQYEYTEIAKNFNDLIIKYGLSTLKFLESPRKINLYHKNPISATYGRRPQVNFKEHYYMVLKAILYHFNVTIKVEINDDEINGATWLIGNGSTINFLGKDFTNWHLIQKLLNFDSSKYNIPNEIYLSFKNRLHAIAEFYNYLIFEKITLRNCKLFLNNCHMAPVIGNNYMDYYSNEFISIIKPILDLEKIDIYDIGLETFPMIEQIYRNCPELRGEHIIPSPIYDTDYELFIGLTVKELYINNINKVENITENFFDANSIFTTNYDFLLEELTNNTISVNHVHGKLSLDDYTFDVNKENPFKIIIGEDSKSKVSKISLESELIEINRKFSTTSGTLCIFGYSGNYNDFHLNKMIRESKSIKKIYYFQYGLDKILSDVEKITHLKENIHRTFGIDQVDAEIIISPIPTKFIL